MKLHTAIRYHVSLFRTYYSLFGSSLYADITIHRVKGYISKNSFIEN